MNGRAELAAPRIGALDGLRGLAVIAVFLVHCVENGPALAVGRLGWWSRNLLNTGWIGVDLFFVLSGFLITGILLDARGSAGYFKNFYARRALRILPIYYLALIIAFVVCGWLLGIDDPDFARLRREQWMFWLHVQNWLIVGAGQWIDGPVPIGHFWTLAVEEQFYLAWPLLVLLPRKLFVAVVLAVIVACPLLRAWLHVRGTPWVAIHVATITRADALALGGLVAVLVRSQVPAATLVRAALIALAVSGAGVGALLIRQRYFTGWSVAPGYSLLAIAGAALVLLAVRLPADHAVVRALSWRPLRWFGFYSYGAYIIHLPVMHWAGVGWRRWLSSTLGDGIAWLPLFILVTIAVTMALAWAVWHLVERHFLKLKRHFPSHPEPA